MKLWISRVSKKDAKLLCKWWNANTEKGIFFFPIKSDRKDRNAPWDVYKQV